VFQKKRNKQSVADSDRLRICFSEGKELWIEVWNSWWFAESGAMVETLYGKYLLNPHTHMIDVHNVFETYPTSAEFRIRNSALSDTLAIWGDISAAFEVSVPETKALAGSCVSLFTSDAFRLVNVTTASEIVVAVESIIVLPFQNIFRVTWSDDKESIQCPI
jgi:hypothetical protein